MTEQEFEELMAKQTSLLKRHAHHKELSAKASRAHSLQIAFDNERIAGECLLQVLQIAW
jgi:hypothetical protein